MLSWLFKNPFRTDNLSVVYYKIRYRNKCNIDFNLSRQVLILFETPIGYGKLALLSSKCLKYIQTNVFKTSGFELNKTANIELASERFIHRTEYSDKYVLTRREPSKYQFSSC